MTGYGRATAERGSRRVTIELRSVNHRFLDVKLRGSIEPALEDAIVSRLRARVERGAITVTARIDRRAATGIAIDRDAARAAFAALRGLADELGTAPPGLDLVVAQPGVVTSRDDDAATSDDADLVLATVAAAEAAVVALAAMRATEGAALARELATRTAALRTLVGELTTLATGVPAEVKRRLDERLRRLLGDTDAGAVDPARLAQEVALLAERADVTEELVRLDSHLEQLAALVGTDAAGGVGRRVDFLLQEVGRELNTIGSKSPSAEIINRIVAAKAELEKLREQAQNVE